LIEKGVCREQARSIVPVGNYTEFYATANLRNWLGFYKLRIAPDAQWEIRQYAQCIDEILNELWPDSWQALKNNSL
jgi:thymidylate synthase (FAD)